VTGEATLRTELVTTLRAMADAGLNKGTSGNASVRLPDGVAPGFLVTPSGRQPEKLTPDELVVIRDDGRVEGALEPSSEWRLHLDVYTAFPDAGAVLHAHSAFATALACQRIEIPSFHYLLALFGGNTIRCADYATFGTQELSDAAVAALQGRRACLLANHGMLVHGRDIDHALLLAVQLEMLSEQYWRSRMLGPPVLLTDAEMADATAQFARYARLTGNPG
jgi:L-fuculose-phosphate aldolase